MKSLIEIENELKKDLIGQDEYCKALATFGFQHDMVNINFLDPSMKPVLMVVGASGSGKNYGIKKLCDIIKTNLINIDCSNLTPTGYKGTTIAKVLIDSIRLNEDFIVLLDEFDKLVDIDRECFYERVKQELLKLLEEEDITYDNKVVDLFNVSFVFAGCYDNLRKQKENNFFEENKIITKEDLNLSEELAGRIKSFCCLNYVLDEDIFRIIKESSGSTYLNYIKFFKKYYHIDYKIEDDVIKDIISFCPSKSLRTISNKLLEIINNSLYDLSTINNTDLITSYTITSHGVKKEYSPEVLYVDTDFISYAIKRLMYRDKHSRQSMESTFEYFDFILYINDLLDIEEDDLCKRLKILFKPLDQLLKQVIGMESFNIDAASLILDKMRYTNYDDEAESMFFYLHSFVNFEEEYNNEYYKY
jgi:ATP-dependent protease Clp ATPase subunit